MNDIRQHAILIIDDNPNNLKVILSHFEAYSFEMYTALDGETGLRRARLAQPDLILLDIQMPGIDGYETCRRLKANPQTADIPVIFMTARTESADKVQGFDVGAVDYVTKPIEVNELMSRVRAHLEIRRLQRAQQAHASQLEDRVKERTIELEREIAQKEAFQSEQERLLQLVRLQSEQLRRLTHQWVADNSAHNNGLAKSLDEHIGGRLALLTGHIQQAAALVEGGVDDTLNGHLESALALLRPAQMEAEALSSTLRKSTPDTLTSSPLLQLSSRECEVLQMTAEGKTNKEISYTLRIAPSTVSTYRNRIMEKTGVEDVPALIRLAVQHRIIN
ncbi:MAG: DNA-binding NarL/FixJ family response regulator [Myxococcota bacterium]